MNMEGKCQEQWELEDKSTFTKYTISHEADITFIVSVVYAKPLQIFPSTNYEFPRYTVLSTLTSPHPSLDQRGMR
jgi:hypothetical protein